MVFFGYEINHSLYDPLKAIEQAKLAENIGFKILWSSDHFHPEFNSNAKCGFSWVWMGATGVLIKKSKLGTRVTSTLGRCHPGIIAHAFATLEFLFPGRIILGLGTGEAMNVRPLGHYWPNYDERLNHLEESIKIIRNLWKKDFVTFHGKYYQLDDANLYLKPRNEIPIFIAAHGKKSAFLAGKYADGIDTSSNLSLLNNTIIPNIKKGAKSLNRDLSEIKLSTSLNISYNNDYEKAFSAAQHNAVWLYPNIYNKNIWDPRKLEELAYRVPKEKIINNICIATNTEDIIKEIEKLTKININQIVIGNLSPEPIELLNLFQDYSIINTIIDN